MNLMENIKYGWIDRKKHKHDIVNQSFSEHYMLQTPQEVIANQLGVCWDQVELERYYFKGHDWNIKTFFLVHYDLDKCPSHTFLTFEKNHKWYWFEHAWEKFKGIHAYETLKELLLDIQNKFIHSTLNGQYEKDQLILWEYKKPEFHISTLDFYKHCEKGNFIALNDLANEDSMPN